MLNIDSMLNSSLKNLSRYKKQTKEAEQILDLQFAPVLIEYLLAAISGRHFSTSVKRLVLKKKIHIRNEEDPNRVIAWAIAQRIREARERQELRQEDLSKLTGIARPNIVRLEQGCHVPSLTTLRKIAEALHLDITLLTAQPVVNQEEMHEFTGLAESGIAEWGDTLEEEDRKD
ncbi:MAG: helix-turn-helix transcriptional regulator [Nitrospirae bacterium]|nr:helix-turn-helix transcriptional regulator [Nitrospirota bacterium]